MSRIKKDDGDNHVAEDKPLPVSHIFKSADETPTKVEAKVIGSIPDWISGDFFRNGPGKFEMGDDKIGHIFDGFAMMHKFEISEGKVYYSSRYLHAETYTQAMAQNRIVFSGFGTVALPDPCKSIFSRFFSFFQPVEGTDNCNVNYLQHGGDFYALTESTKIIKVDPKVMETQEKLDLSKYIAVNIATAHPHYTSDGTIYNMGSSFGSRNFYNIIKIPPWTPGSTTNPFEKASIFCKIPGSSTFNPSYFHTFAITPNYIVFIEQPLTINVFKMLCAKFLGRDFVGCIDYKPSSLAKFHVIRLEDGAILPQKYTADAFFCFHHINAFEDDGHLVVDLCAHDDIQVITNTYMEAYRNCDSLPVTKAVAKRFVLPLEEKITAENKDNLVSLDYCDANALLREDGAVHCTPEVLCSKAFELPRINYEHYNGLKYRYLYCLGGDGETLVKVDTVDKTFKLWGDTSCYPSEPVFIPRPGGHEEDDGTTLLPMGANPGVVLSSIIDLKGTGRPPFLVILDAKTFTETARAEIPADVPFGIHGIFIPK